MFNKNDGSNEHDILQNQFTSFLSFAISNARIDYIRAKIKRLQREQITEQFEILFAEETFQIEDFMENESVSQAIRRIHEKERYVFLSRVVEEKKFRYYIHKRTVNSGVGIKGHICIIEVVDAIQFDPAGAAFGNNLLRRLATPFPGYVGVYRLQIGRNAIVYMTQ